MSSSLVRHLGIIAMRAVALILLSNLFIVAAQTVDDRQARIAAALKLFEEAAASGNQGGDAEKLAAIEKLKIVENVFEELKDEDNLASALSVHGMYLSVTGQFDPALEYLNRALAIFRKLSVPVGEAANLMGIGNLHLKRGDLQRARMALEEAFDITEKTEIPQFDLPIRYSLANVYIELKDYKKTFDIYSNACRIAALRSEAELAIAYKNYANGYIRLGLAVLAPAMFKKALDLTNDSKLQGRRADILDQLGGVYLYHLSQPETARGYFLEALKVAEPLDLPLLKAEVLDGLGQCAFRLMEVSQAIDYYNRALTYVPKFPDSEGRNANLLFNIAQIDLLLDENTKARVLLDRARPLAKTAGEPLLEANILQSLAAIADREGDLKRAVELSNEAGLMITKQPNAGKEVIDWLGNYALLCLRAGVTKEPIEYMTKTLPNARTIGYAFGEATLWDTLGIAYYVTGDYKKAVESYNKALLIFRSLRIKPREARSLENLMTAWVKLGNPNLAIFFGKNAVNLFQSFRKNSSNFSSDQQKAFSENFASAYRSLSEVLIQQGRIAEAEQVLTLLKQEELLQYVRRDDMVAKEMLATLPVSEGERAAISRYAAIAEQMTALGKEFDDLDTERKQFEVGTFPKQKRYDELKQRLADATVVFEKFLEELKLKFGQKNTSVALVDSGLKKTLERIKAKRTAVVSTIVGEDTLNIIVTTSQTQRAHTVRVSAKEINDLVATLRTSLTSPQYDPRPASQKLYDLIVKPIEGDLAGIKADTIVWSLDGTLRYLPPAALWDKQKGYLVERFANVIVNLANRTSLEKEPVNFQQLSVLGVGVSKSVEGFAPLAAVPDELDCIISDKTAGILSAKPQCTSGVLTGRKLLDEKFTLANFEGELGRYPIVHIASHFKLVPGDDKNSFLLLGGGTDRKFTVEKLRTEKLGDLELMVLSACNTATPAGARTNGIEVESFSALAQEEARSVIATLWSVSDPSTKDFMVEFYRLYGMGGISKAIAVRRAQLKLMYGKYSADEAQKHRADEFVTAVDKSQVPFKADPNAPYAHPFYWSPFTLSGNWQ